MKSNKKRHQQSSRYFKHKYILVLLKLIYEEIYMYVNKLYQFGWGVTIWIRNKASHTYQGSAMDLTIDTN